MTSSGFSTGSLELDLPRGRVYTTNNHEITLWTSYLQDPPKLAYLNHIPVVRTWVGEKIRPVNLLLYNAGEELLLGNTSSPGHTYNLDIESGVVVNKQATGQPIARFDYNIQGAQAQFDKYLVGINSATIMRFNIDSGLIAHKKTYQRTPYFTALASDYDGNVFTGELQGKIKCFPDLTKPAAKCFEGLGDPITALKVSSQGAVLATTETYFIYLPDFNSSETYYLGKLPEELRKYLNLEAKAPMLSTQFFGRQEQSIIFSMGRYLFQCEISRLMAGKQEFTVNTASQPILAHKRGYALTQDSPCRFTLAP